MVEKVDLAQVERNLRAQFAAEPRSDVPHIAVQQRTAEIEVQYAVWIASEFNLDTPAELSAHGFGACVASCLRNFLEPFDPDHRATLLAYYFQSFQATFNDGRSVRDMIAAKHGIN